MANHKKAYIITNKETGQVRIYATNDPRNITTRATKQNAVVEEIKTNEELYAIAVKIGLKKEYSWLLKKENAIGTYAFDKNMAKMYNAEKALKNYHSKKHVSLLFDYEEDKDIIEKLDKVYNKSKYIGDLILADINKK